MAGNTAHGLLTARNINSYPKIGRCLNFGGNCTKNCKDRRTINSELFLLEFKIKKPKY
jgi:hypothetical protein